MSDIHQEWKDLRAKNGEFLNHLDCMTAKLEKKQVELKHREHLQDLSDAGAFAMQFAVPFNCCQDDRDILKALNKAQADRIETLEKELIARKEQQQIDLAVKKDLDKKLDKATADYRALWVERDLLKEQLTAQGKTLANAQACNVELSSINTALRQSNDKIREMAKKANQQRHEAIEMANRLQVEIKNLQTENYILKHAGQSCNTYAQQGMQSKIAKQAAEIKRLTKENEEIQSLNEALNQAAKDADANFERGKIKGMTEIWKELVDCYNGRPIGENQKIFGYCNVGDILMNLSPTWFINKAEEYHKQEKKEACNVQIGDEVQCFDLFYPDDDPHSDIGIVVAVDSDKHSFAVIGPNFEGCFDTTDIQFGTVKKTGRHFDSIPLDYFK